MTSPEREAWVEQARAADILSAAQRLGAALKRAGSEWVGPCPAGCSSHDGFSVNPRKNVFNCRKGGDGGDVIRLVMHAKACDFNAAVTWINDESAPAPERKARPNPPDDAKYREKEIAKARGIWAAGVAIAGTAAEAYLRARGIDRLPPGYELRFAAEQPYWHKADNDIEAKVIHSGPALLGALSLPDLTITGCHITWLNPDQPGHKLALWDPDTMGEGKTPMLLPAKKLRGSKRRAAEKIQNPKGGGKRLVLGEGRETVLSVWLAERATMRAAWTYYWSAIDLGHLGGKARDTVVHPTLMRPDGKPLRVPGPIPDQQPERDLAIPDEVTELVLLGDGDSDRFTTEMALRRAGARFDRQGRVCKIAWAPEGQDFNDMLRGGN